MLEATEKVLQIGIIFSNKDKQAKHIANLENKVIKYRKDIIVHNQILEDIYAEYAEYFI